MFLKIKDFEAKVLAHEDRREELYEIIDGYKEKIRDLNEKITQITHDNMEKDIIISKIGHEDDRILIHNLQKNAAV